MADPSVSAPTTSEPKKPKIRKSASSTSKKKVVITEQKAEDDKIEEIELPEECSAANIAKSILSNEQIQKDANSIMKEIPTVLKQQREEMKHQDVGLYSILVNAGVSRMAVSIACQRLEKAGWKTCQKVILGNNVNRLLIIMSVGDGLLPYVHTEDDLKKFKSAHSGLTEVNVL
jgi:hypothetical protein